MKVHTYTNSTALFLDWEGVCEHKEFTSWNELRRFMGTAFRHLLISDVISHNRQYKEA